MSDFDPPLIVQGDASVLLEVANPGFREAREALLAFAELVKSPEHFHTYRLTPLSIWNARAAGLSGERILETLATLSRYPIPGNVAATVRDQARRYGRLELRRLGEGLVLTADEPTLAEELARNKALERVLARRLAPRSFHIQAEERGRLKQLCSTPRRTSVPSTASRPRTRARRSWSSAFSRATPASPRS